MVSEVLDDPGLFNSFSIYWTLHLLSCFMDFQQFQGLLFDSSQNTLKLGLQRILSDLPSNPQIVQWLF